MLPAKYLNGNAVLAIPAYAVTQIKTDDVADLNKQLMQKAKQNNQSKSKSEGMSLELCGA